MSSNDYILKIIAVSVALALTVTLFTSCINSDKPNVIFFLTDDQNNTTLGCTGHPIVQTPVIDKLASEGVRFNNTFVTTSICAASRASILTGLYERTHRYTFGTPPIKEVYMSQSYPMLLRAGGYHTGLVGKLGVDVQEGEVEKMFDEIMYIKPRGKNPYFIQLPDGSRRHATDLAADYAIDFLHGYDGNDPFYLSVSFSAAHAVDNDKENHYPWPSSVDGMYENVEMPPPRLSDPSVFDSLPGFLQNSFNRERFFWRWDTPEKYQKNMQGYLRMISSIDIAIGRVIDELKRLNLDQNTIIIYMADNGYYMGNRGLAGKWSHFEESLRVPLIIYDPRLPNEQRGKVLDNLALNIDVASTILDICDIDIPKQYEGRNLLPLVHGSDVNNWRTDFFCEHLMEVEKIAKWEGVRDERYVYARYFEQEPPYEFLHDLKYDPDQLRNFTANPDYSQILEKMRTRCNEYIGNFKEKADFTETALIGSAPDSLAIASVSFVPKKWDKAANAETIEALTREAVGLGAKLVVVPEGALEGYVVNDVIYEENASQKDSLTKRFIELAEPTDGEYISRFYQLADELDIYLIMGYLETRDQNIYNCAVLIGPDGLRMGHYYKTHFWQGYDVNPPGYTPGSTFPVFQLGDLKLGIMICADRQFPEVARLLTMKGSDLIVCPAYGNYGERNTAMMRTRAFENQVYVVFTHPQHSLIIDKDGSVIGECNTDNMLIKNIPWKSHEKRRPSVHYRRPDLYQQSLN